YAVQVVRVAARDTAAPQPAKTSARDPAANVGAPDPAADAGTRDPDAAPAVNEGTRDPAAATSQRAPKSAAPGPTAPAAPAWLRAFEDNPRVQRVFAHLAEHGAISETDVAALLGGPRQLRAFSLKFREYVARAPF